MRLALLYLLITAGVQAKVRVITYRNNLARTGENLEETILTPANVNTTQFGKIRSYPVDGQVYAQPLYMPEVTIQGKGRHNVVFVATEHNSVYAFDADSSADVNNQPLWQTSLTDAAMRETTVSAQDVMNCPTIAPELGITGTPVIDPSTNTLYVVALTKRDTLFFHRLHALNIATGAERLGSPVLIEATVAGAGGDLFSPSPVTFLPYFHKNRAGLLLLNGVIYTSWASHCDSRSYHGWIIAFDASDFHKVSVFNSTPNANRGAFWMGGAAPAADPEGNIFVVSGNGTFDGNANGVDLGDSVIKLSSPGLAVVDYFTPFNQLRLDAADIDLGSSGAVLLPDIVGSAAHRRLLVTAGKEGRIYLLDRDQLGHFNAARDSQIVQSIEGAIRSLFGGPAYFNNTLYFAAWNDRVKAFPISGAHVALAPSSQSTAVLAYPGAVPAVSANGASNGILWLVEGSSGGTLRAYDASNLTNELYNSQTNSSRDALGSFVRFSVPTVAEGRVYVGTGNSLAVFGLLEPGSRDANAGAPGGSGCADQSLRVDFYQVGVTEGRYAERERLPRLVAEVEAVRTGGGPDLEIGLDMWETLSVRSAIDFELAVAPMKPIFIEEPTWREMPEALGEIAAKSPVPLAGDKGLVSRYEFKHLLDAKGTRILQPDVIHCGGITEMGKIASLGELYGAEMAPHMYYGPVAHVASLQSMAAVRNFLIQEWDADMESTFTRLTRLTFPVAKKAR
jgi:hypothetical protein